MERKTRDERMQDLRRPHRRPNLAQRRELQLAAVQRLESALRDGSDQEAVEAAAEVRALGAPAPEVRWEAVYMIEERYRDLELFRSALQDGNEDRLADAWCTLRGRWENYLSPEEQQAGRVAFQHWGRGLRRQGGQSV
jgi:hypothetical protein